MRSVIWRWTCEMVLRRTSVGCAVTTGQTSAPVSSRATASASRSAASMRLERGREAALLRRRALAPVEAPPALVVDVLGQVGQQREVAERADDVVGRLDVEPAEPARPAPRGRPRTGGS